MPGQWPLDICPGDLDICPGDLNICPADLDICPGDLDICAGDLDICPGDLPTQQRMGSRGQKVTGTTGSDSVCFSSDYK